MAAPPDGPAVLALDIGTSSARALLYDGRGLRQPDVQAAAPLVWEAVDGGFEAPAEELARTVDDLLDQAVARLRTTGRAVDAVAVATFWHSLLGVDADGRAVIPLLPWMDGRSAAVVRRLRARVDERALHARTGARLHPSYPLAKIRWLGESRPQEAARVRRWLAFPEYLLLRWFGHTYAHVSMASGTGLLDQRTRQWDPEALALAGVHPDALPGLADTPAAASGLREPYAARWPPLARCPWFGPFGDGGTGNVGVGCLERGRVAVMVGTSGAMRVAWRGEPVTPPWGLWTYRIDGSRPVMGGALSNGGNLFTWARQVLALDPDDVRLQAALAEVPPDGHGLTVLPFWAGERSPDYPEEARGLLVGFGLETTPVQVLRALMEAVAYRFGILYRLLQPHLPPLHRIVATGQALLRSAVWTQILADVLGQAVDLVDVQEASARGAALLALEALGEGDPIARPPAVVRTIKPGPATAVYREALARHERLSTYVLAGGPAA